MLERTNDEIMAKPTAIDSGTNRERTGSAMMNAGMNTDRMHKSARSLGTAVALAAFRTAVAVFGVVFLG